MMTKPKDLWYAAMVLFMRVLQRDQSERPKLHAEPGVGGEWLVAIYIGEVPPKLAAHYARQAEGVAKKAAPRREGEEDPDVLSRVGRGRTVEEGLAQIVEELTTKLRLRMSADAGAWEIAFGQPPPRPATVLHPDPDAEPPVEGRASIVRRGG